jgi:inner membrane protein
MRALVVFSLLYVLIYLLLRLEDDALLIGAISSFLAVAATMYFTRRIDWYSSIPVPGGMAQAGTGSPRDGA